MPTAVLLIVSWLHVCVLALLTCVAATSGFVSQHFNTLHATGTAHLFLAVGADLRLLRRRRAAGFSCSAFSKGSRMWVDVLPRREFYFRSPAFLFPPCYPY